MARELYAVTLNGWQKLATSLTANGGDLPHLETHRTRLTEVLQQAQDLSVQQATFTASKQETSKRLRTLIEEGRKLATFLRVGVKQHYGNRSEKLLEFGVRPFRSRRRPTDAGETPPPVVTPPAPTKP